MNRFVSVSLERELDYLEHDDEAVGELLLTDDDNAKVVLFAFAAGDGLKEHIAPLPAIIQIIKGGAELTVGEEAAAGKPARKLSLRFS